MMMLTAEQAPRKNLPRRERLNPDWPIAVFSFRAWPLAKPPQSLWDTARAMQALWNECVALFDRASTLDLKSEDNEPLRPKDERRAVWLPFGQRKTERREGKEDVYDHAATLWNGEVPSLHLLGRKYKGIIPSACYEAVLSRFILTVKLWQQGKSKPPREHRGLDRINIPIVFNDGVTLPQLATHEKVSLRYTAHLPRDTQEYRANAHFSLGINNDRLPLHVAFHRPLAAQAVKTNHWKHAIPDQHRIKAVSLIGDRTSNLGWQWSLQVRTEYADTTTERTVTGRSCGLDLGWRVREDGLRIGYLTDTEGREIEIVLPYTLDGREERRAARRFGEEYHVHDWRDLAEWQMRLDDRKDALKFRLRLLHDAEPFPPEAAKVMNGFDRLGRRGLLKLLTLLPDGAAKQIIEQWAEWDRVESRRRYGSEARLREKWADARRQIAAWLTATYDVIVWEEDLDLKEMAGSKKKRKKAKADAGQPTDPLTADEHATDEMQKWRARACHSDFRARLRQGAQKRKTELRDGGTAFSSQICAECGAAIPPSRRLLTVCENDHINDQDANTSQYFCKQLQPHAGTPSQQFEIPAHLRGYLRVLRAAR